MFKFSPICSAVGYISKRTMEKSLSALYQSIFSSIYYGGHKINKGALALCSGLHSNVHWRGFGGGQGRIHSPNWMIFLGISLRGAQTSICPQNSAIFSSPKIWQGPKTVWKFSENSCVLCSAVHQKRKMHEFQLCKYHL